MDRLKILVKGFFKHLFLLIITNVLAGAILSVVMNIIMLLSGESKLDRFVIGIFMLALFISAPSFVITFIPSILSLTIVKNLKTNSLLPYVISGIFAPLFVYLMLLIKLTVPDERLDGLGLIFLIAATGSICGYVYGILDKELQEEVK